MTGNQVRKLTFLIPVIWILLCLLVLPVGGQAVESSQPTIAAEPSGSPQKQQSDQSDDQSTGQSNKQKLKKQKLQFVKQGGVVYQTIDGEELKCDIYTPEGDGPFPAILAVHGGAWRQGSKFSMMRHAWKMAESGYVVVAINYRHAPKHPFPAQIHDCKHAIRWIQSKAKEMKVDPQRLGAFGYSAGGHLVSLLGTSDQDDGLEGPIAEGHEKFSTRVKVVAAGGAPGDFGWIDDDSRVLRYWLGGTPNEKPENFRAASPTTYVSADDPPFFFYHGKADMVVPVSSSQRLHEKLKEAGVDSQHFAVKRGFHLTTFSDIAWMEKAIDFFDQHLKNENEELEKNSGAKINEEPKKNDKPEN